MKKFLLLWVFFGFLGCNNDDSSNSEQSLGLITAVDKTLCACYCGDFYIDIQGETYRFQTYFLPENDIDFSQIQLPFSVRLEWEAVDPNTSCPAEDRITIYSMHQIAPF
ncbi:MAG: hypothetical protein AAFP76_15990 [Bacteroidota bacterium]